MRFVLVGKSSRLAISVLQAIRCFSGHGSYVLGDGETASLQFSSCCKKHFPIDFDPGNDAAFIDLINRMALEMPGSLVIPFDCDGIKLVNRVCHRLNMDVCPVPDSPTLEMFDDKWKFHQFCTANGFEVPASCFIGAKTELDFKCVAASLGLPFVLKPTDCSGSTGVRFISTPAQYQREVLSNPAYTHDKLIVQRYIPGTDIDLSLLSFAGQLSSMAIQQVHGARIRFLSNAYLEAVATEICRKSEYHGVMHIDARIEAGTGKVFLIECNPRFWASLTATVKCGVNFVEHCVQPALQGKKGPFLFAGIAAMRHPLLRPSCWKVLVSDSTMHGRLLRAELLDSYTFAQLLCQLPMMAFRLARRVGGLPLRRVRRSSLRLAGTPRRQ